jgi:hypothetical protein
MRTFLHSTVQAACVCAALLIAPAMAAQNTTTTLPQAPLSETTLFEAGSLIEKDGKLRKTAVFLTLGGGLIGGLILSAADGEPSQVAAGAVIMGGCAVAGIGLNIGAASKAQRAGRLLQRK